MLETEVVAMMIGKAALRGPDGRFVWWRGSWELEAVSGDWAPGRVFYLDRT